MFCIFFFFKQKTAYEMRISDWSSDVCSSDLLDAGILKTSPFDELPAPPSAPAAPASSTVVRPTAARNGPSSALHQLFAEILTKIGRASCRERVCQYV